MKFKTSKKNDNVTYSLLELSAIPPEVRISYLDKLSKEIKKNDPKKIKVLQKFYNIIERNELSYGSPEEICDELEISKGQLYWYKCRILRELRELFFGWKEIEKSISIPSGKTLNGNHDIQALFLKAKKMAKIGMRKEAEKTFRDLAGILEGKRKNPRSEILLTLSEIYEHLLQYYFDRRNFKGYNRFLNKLKDIFNEMETKRKGFSKEQKSLINIRFYYANAYKRKFHNYQKNSDSDSIKFLKKAFDEAQKNNNTDYKILIYYKLYAMADRLKEKNAEEYLKEGYKLTKNNSKYKLEHLAYKSALLYSEFINIGRDDSKKYFKKLEELHNKADKINPINKFSIYCTERYIRMTLNFDHVLYIQELERLIGRQILYSQIKIAIFNMYQLSEGFYSFVLKKDENKREYISVGEINWEKLTRREERINETLKQIKNIYTVDFRLRLLIDSLECELWKEWEEFASNYNNEKIKNKIKKIERICRKEKIPESKIPSEFEIIKLGIHMKYEYRYRNRIYLKKYRDNFDCKLKLLRDKVDNPLTFYILICHIAEQTKSEEILDIAIKHYEWLKEKESNLIKYLKREINLTNLT